MTLAERGAKVVVNDLGGAVNGVGSSAAAADQVVAEIRARGGTAVSSYDSVADPAGAENMVRTAIDNFGKLDILVNNAGILRDKSLAKLEIADIDAVIKVHLQGTFYCTRAAWPHMVRNNYGRIVFTSSTSGLCGNFGQSNYGAAKSGMVGMMNCLFREGAKYNILVNTVAPAALTRMTEGLVPEALGKYQKPEHVSPIFAYLCSEQCKVTDQVFLASAGAFHRIEYYINEGVCFDPDGPITVDMLAGAFDRLASMDGARPLGQSMMPWITADLQKLGKLP
ncbi:MAG: SDR family NAD(P)-dependent oxidoreductase [Gammaproteobacteria bacterium]